MKKIIVLLTVIAIVFAVSSCSDKSQDPRPTGDNGEGQVDPCRDDCN